MNKFEVAQRFKREWTKEAFTRGAFARDAYDHCVSEQQPEAVKMCMMGKLSQITNPTWDENGYRMVGPQVAIDFQKTVLAKLEERGIPFTIEDVNDGEDGYEILSSVIDDILVEEGLKYLTETYPTVFTPENIIEVNSDADLHKVSDRIGELITA